jgi:PucR C-terminal helix-turn-helix domain
VGDKLWDPFVVDTHNDTVVGEGGLASEAVEVMFDDVASEVPGIVEGAVERVRAELPAFQAIDAAALQVGLPAAFLACLTAARENRALTPGEVAAIADVGARRADQGLPLAEMLRASRLFVQIGFEEIEQAALRNGVDTETRYTVARRIWRVTDQALFASTTGHHRRQIELTRRAGRVEADLIRRLLSGAMDGNEAVQAVSHHGLVSSRSYLVVRARPRRSEDRLERLFAASALDALVDVVDGDVVAITASVPDLDGIAHVGVGGPAAVEDIASANRAAERALAAAVALDSPVPVHEAEAPLEVAAVHDNATGRLAERRCFAGIPERTMRRLDLERTLDAFLARDLRVEPAAASLHIHPNTLRHRVRRFEEAAGLRLAQPRDAFLVWWALRYRRAERHRTA